MSVSRRSVYYDDGHSLRPLIENGMLEFFDRKEIDEWYNRLLKLRDELRVDYVDGNLFGITKSVAQYLERMIGLPVTDSEVAYLTLHFGAFLKIAEKKHPKLRILIVCVNGISTVRIRSIIPVLVVHPI